MCTHVYWCRLGYKKQIITGRATACIKITQQAILKLHDSRINVKFATAERQGPLGWEADIWGFPAPPQNEKLPKLQRFRSTGTNPLLVKFIGFMQVMMNRSTEVNIWCDSVGKLGIYRQKTRWGIILKNFWNPLAPKLQVRLKNIRGCKNGTDIFYLHAKFGGNHGGVRKKSWEFLFFLFVTLWILN